MNAVAVDNHKIVAYCANGMRTLMTGRVAKLNAKTQLLESRLLEVRARPELVCRGP